jgi:hypothetical protein
MKQKIVQMKLRLFFLLFGILTVVSCNKNNNHPVPNIPFDFTIDINLPSYSGLMGVGGWTYVNGGSKGIIVYRRAIDEFVAFDRHSPADVNGTCSWPLYPMMIISLRSLIRAILRHFQCTMVHQFLIHSSV